MKFDILPFLEKYYTKDEKIIVACSTGADSMFLLYHLLHTKYKNNIVACYLNHNTRKQCQEEEDFLLELWEKEGFQVEIASCDFEKIKKLYPRKWFEELAREKRYQFFDAICNIYNTNKLITAHHLDDRIETYMFNMLRWSKLTGLINMTESSWWILRPLLEISKSEIYTYLYENKLVYFEDESNKDNSFTRNYLRNEILPLFEHVHPWHKKNLKNLLEYFQEIKQHIDSEVCEFLWNWNQFSISLFQMSSPLLQKEIIRAIYYKKNWNSTIGLSEWNIAEVIKFIGWKNNKTKKEIQHMKLFKDGDIIRY